VEESKNLQAPIAPEAKRQERYQDESGGSAGADSQRTTGAVRLPVSVLALLALLVVSQGYSWFRLEEIRTSSQAQQDQSAAAIKNLQKQLENQATALDQVHQQLMASNGVHQVAISPAPVLTDHLHSPNNSGGSEPPGPTNETPIAAQKGAWSVIGGSASSQLRAANFRSPRSPEESPSPKSVEATHDISGPAEGKAEDANPTSLADQGQPDAPVARNHSDVEKLRRLGSRDYVEFALVRSDTAQQVTPGISIQLKRTDARRSRCDLDIFADNYELPSNQAALDPLWFSIGTGWQTESVQLVISEIQKDRVAGYISAPKGVLTAQR